MAHAHGFCALACCLLLLSSPGHASSAPPANTSTSAFTWQDLAPPLRHGHSTIYDPVGDRVLLHGGQIAGAAQSGSNDTWELVLASGTPVWSHLSVTGATPPNSVFQVAIHDALRNRMIVLIGGGRFGVWALSLADLSWQQLAADQAPPFAWFGASTVYDSRRDRLVTFGGSSPGLHGTDFHNDVWSLALSGAGTWEPVASHGTPPTPRQNHVAAYDSLGDRMVVFGGAGATVRNNETWALDFSGDSAWVQLAPSGTIPGARAGCASATDPATGALFIFGGDGSSGNDVWSLALQGSTTWSAVTPTNALPSPRSGTSLAFDPLRHRLLLHDGIGNGETWELSLAQEIRWTLLGTPPPARAYHTAVYDSVGQSMVVFGGFGPTSNYTNDTWAKDLGPSGSWTKLMPAGASPPPRAEHAAVLDPAMHRMIVFGGDGGPANLNDTWELSLDGDAAWTQLFPLGTPPVARWSMSAIQDPQRNAMIVFGGVTTVANTFTYWNDVWALSLGSPPAWTKLSPTGIAPSPRAEASAVYDAARHRMLVFGGLAVAGLSDTVWALSLDPNPAWSVVPAIGTPGARVWESAIYDSDLDRLVVFGGYNQGNDTWVLSLSDPPQWTPLGPFEKKPARRIEHTSIYDTRNRRLVVYGGFTPGQGGETVNFADTWALPLSVGDPSTPVLISLVDASAEPGVIRVKWLTTLYSGLSAEIYRSSGDAWEAVSAASPDGGGYVVYEDRNVIPGGRYGYCLGVSGEGPESMFGETWLDVPLAAGPRVALALEAVYPNPARRNLFVAFSLPDALPATLELYDVSGRRIVEQTVGPLGGGRHVVNLAKSSSLSPGIYLVRLSRGNEQLLAKACVVR